MSDELEQARKVNQTLNRRAQEMEKKVRVAEGLLAAAEGRAQHFAEQKERGRREVNDELRRIGRSREPGPIRDSQELRMFVGSLLAEKDRLEAENKTLRDLFGDACQEPGAMGDALALARREGRRESLEHWLNTPPGQWPEWLKELDAAVGGAVSASLAATAGSVGDLLARYGRPAVTGPDAPIGAETLSTESAR